MPGMSTSLRRLALLGLLLLLPGSVEAALMQAGYRFEGPVRPMTDEDGVDENDPGDWMAGSFSVTFDPASMTFPIAFLAEFDGARFDDLANFLYEPDSGTLSFVAFAGLDSLALTFADAFGNPGQGELAYSIFLGSGHADFAGEMDVTRMGVVPLPAAGWAMLGGLALLAGLHRRAARQG